MQQRLAPTSAVPSVTCRRTDLRFLRWRDARSPAPPPQRRLRRQHGGKCAHRHVGTHLCQNKLVEAAFFSFAINFLHVREHLLEILR